MTFKKAQLQLPQPDGQDCRAELAAGLTAHQATIAPKFLYDAIGSTLFEAICLLDEYELTHTEAGIIEANLDGVARAIASGAVFADLGAGNCVKAAKLLPVLRQAAYFAVDLLKSAAALEAAYDDALGVTAAFNINILRRVNRDLGADFDLRSWRHIALFNAPLSRVEMHLEAQNAQTIHWPGGVRHFAKGERIHTENSYKYSSSDFLTLLARSGFIPANTWTDHGHKFLVCYARVFKDHAHE